MAVELTRPLAEDLRFRSSATGEHILDAYLEACEKGGRTLPELLDIIFDATGEVDSHLAEFRVSPTTRIIQWRLGLYTDPDAGWIDLLGGALLNPRGPWTANTDYLRCELVEYLNTVYVARDDHTSGTDFDLSQWMRLVDIDPLTALYDGVMQNTSEVRALAANVSAAEASTASNVVLAQSLADATSENSATVQATATTVAHLLDQTQDSAAAAAAAATLAQQAASAITNTMVDAGPYDASTGVLPSPVTINNVVYSSMWRVTVAGTVGGFTLAVGDSLVFTTATSSYYTVTNSAAVASINGMKGAVTLTYTDVNAEKSGTAATLMATHEAKAGAHPISGVTGLQAQLDAKYSASNKPTPAELGAVPTTRTINSKSLTADITLTPADVAAVPLTRTVNGKALSADITLTPADVSAVASSTTINGKALTGAVTMTYSDVGAVPTTRTVNSKPLSANITLTPADVSAVPLTRTVNSKALSDDITLTPADIGAVPSTRTLNGKALSADIALTSADTGSVPTSRAVNGKPLSADITLAASDVGALPSTGGTISGNTITTGYQRANGEVQTTSSNSYRQVYGNYGTFWRQDGSSLYLMLTNSGDHYGSYNSLRPLYVNLSSGATTLGHDVTVGGAATFNSTVYAAGTGNFSDVYIRSDARLKENVTPITSALAKVISLTGCTYDKKPHLNATTSVREAGLIAQDVLAALPEAVATVGRDALLTLSSAAVNALLVEAIKELKQEIDDLKGGR